jgi:hypothetical protein
LASDDRLSRPRSARNRVSRVGHARLAGESELEVENGER